MQGGFMQKDSIIHNTSPVCGCAQPKKITDLNPLLTQDKASIESDRCYFCHDAPCIEACPTEINIPNFIGKIKTNNIQGAAVEILKENIMGGTCARVCPVESLCEQACVRNTQEEKPVKIGQLQRYATDWLFAHNIQPFKREHATGNKVAIVGAGPAGIACAHALAREGHEVVIYDSKEKAGGLNEYGLAAYKMTDNFAQREIDFILSLGGIELKLEHKLGEAIFIDELKKQFNAVFIALGLAGMNALGIAGEELPGVYDALDYIAQIRQKKENDTLPVGRNVMVLGGGSTAIDIAIQIKQLGAQEVTLLYRRGPKAMRATEYERALAQKQGVNIRYWLKPVEIFGDDNVQGIRCVSTRVDFSNENKSEEIIFKTDMIFKAIGQYFKNSMTDNQLEMNQGRIWVDTDQQTSLAGVFAGGDCINEGEDLTVHAVQQGKQAAQAMSKFLAGVHHG